MTWSDAHHPPLPPLERGFEGEHGLNSVQDDNTKRIRKLPGLINQIMCAKPSGSLTLTSRMQRNRRWLGTPMKS